jgi:large subunit ribosomal protein L3
MVKSILGTKVGMTQIFDQRGDIVPVTVVAAGPCLITSIRTAEKDGYSAVQLGFGEVNEKSLNKPELGFFKKKNLAPKKYLKEFRVKDTASYQIGQEIKVDVFKPGDYVDVTGISKGKGFAGGVKRHGFRGGPATHGQKHSKRRVGSIGATYPERVIKGMRMAGRMGGGQVTQVGLEIVKVDAEKNLLLIKGCVPGNNGSLLKIVSE